MKGLLYFVMAVVAIAGFVSAFWWLHDGSTLKDQWEYIKYTFSESVADSAALNTAESASKLGNVLKNSLEEAQDVYHNGAEAKY